MNGTWKDFDRVDWEGLAGATPFPNGAEPMIAYVKVDGFEAMAVLDAAGVWLHVLEEDGDTVAQGEFDSAGQAARFAATLKAEYSTDELVAAGWNRD